MLYLLHCWKPSTVCKHPEGNEYQNKKDNHKKLLFTFLWFPQKASSMEFFTTRTCNSEILFQHLLQSPSLCLKRFSMLHYIRLHLILTPTLNGSALFSGLYCRNHCQDLSIWSILLAQKVSLSSLNLELPANSGEVWWQDQALCFSLIICQSSLLHINHFQSCWLSFLCLKVKADNNDKCSFCYCAFAKTGWSFLKKTSLKILRESHSWSLLRTEMIEEAAATLQSVLLPAWTAGIVP